MKKRIQILLLCIAIAAGAILAYWPHVEYSFPLIGDEYVHISFSKYITEEHKLPFENPYFAVPFAHTNFELGFDLFLTAIFSLIPSDPLFYYQFFPAAFVIINGLLLFYLVVLWFKDYWSALFAVFFFGTIKSTAGLLAHQYFIPLTLGTTLLLLSFILFHKWIETRNHAYLLLLGLVLVALALSYPPAFFFFIGAMFIYILSMDHTLHEFFHTTRKKFLQYFSGLSVLCAALFIAALLYLHIFDAVIFSTEWNVIQTYLSPIFLFGIIPSTFAIVGLYATAVSEHPASKIILYWFLFSVITLYFFNLFDVSILIPAPRLFIFYALGVSVLAGVGMATLIRLAKPFLITKRHVALAVALFAVFPLFHYYTVFAKPLEHHQILSRETYTALTFLEKEYPGEGIVVTDSITSLGVYPASGKYVVNLLSSNIGGGDPEAAHAFLTGDCRAKMENAFNRFSNLTIEINLDTIPIFLLSPIKQNCPEFLDTLYNEGTYVYAVLPTKTPVARIVLAGNTLEGNDWIEYYGENGNIWGMKKPTGELYTGTWSPAGGPQACFVYSFDKKTTECETKSVRGNVVYSFAPDGTPLPKRKAMRFVGNEYNL